MDYTYSLLVLFVILSFIHFGFLTKNLVKSFVTRYFSNSNEIVNLSYTPKKNTLRIILSILFFTSPLLLFLSIKDNNFQNEALDIFFLITLILLTGYLIYFHEYKLWSEKFNDDADSTHPIKKLNEELIYNKSTLEKDILLTKKHIGEIDKNTNKIQKEFEELKAEKSNRANKTIDFNLFFKNKSQYDTFITLLTENDFYNEKHKHTPTYLCILTTKLSDLKVINIHQKNKYFCKAIADHFKIDHFDQSNLSTSMKDHKQNSSSHAHKDIFDSFKYLDNLIEI